MGKHHKDKDPEHKSKKHSSKHKHRHSNDDTEKESRPSDADGLGVKSANAWEDVKFDSKDRKDKFLRLMGAEKQRKHGGKIQIGEKTVQHNRAGQGVEEMGKNLEKQFKDGLEYRSSFNRHAGFGASSAGSSTLLQKKSVRLDGGDDEDNEPEKPAPKSTGKYMMNFVKSSD